MLPHNPVTSRCRLQALLSRELYVTLAVCRLRQLEGKVATLSVINDALQKENDTLREVPICYVQPCYMQTPAALHFVHRCGSQMHQRGSCVTEQQRQFARTVGQPSQSAADGEAANAAAELAELQEEFQRRLGAADRTIAALKVG